MPIFAGDQCRRRGRAMPIYAFHWPTEGWVKLGWADDVGQRAADSFADNSHPDALCGKLTPPHFKLVGLWEGTRAEEEELQKQMNEGKLPRKDNANEFYEASEQHKILRDLQTNFAALPFPEQLPPPGPLAKRSRACCRGWAHWCNHCGATFANNANRKRHLENPPPACKRARLG